MTIFGTQRLLRFLTAISGLLLLTQVVAPLHGQEPGCEGNTVSDLLAAHPGPEVWLNVTPSDGDYYFGQIIYRDGEWIAFYDGAFVVLEVAGCSENADGQVLMVDSWAERVGDDGSTIRSDTRRYRIAVHRLELLEAIRSAREASLGHAVLAVTAVLQE